MKKTTKQLVLFLILMFVSLGLGFGVGAFLSSVQPDFTALATSLFPFFKVFVPAVWAVLTIVMMAIAYGNIRHAKRLIRCWDGENEDVADDADHCLEIAITICNIGLIVSFFFFGAMTAMETVSEGNLPSWWLIASSVWFLLALFVQFYFSHQCVEQAKVLYPEKKGNLLDFRFQKKWQGSFDEAEMQKAHQAGFAAYRAGNTCCLILWLVSILSMLFANAGIMPLAMVCVIWFVMTLTYSINSMKK